MALVLSTANGLGKCQRMPFRDMEVMARSRSGACTPQASCSGSSEVPYILFHHAAFPALAMYTTECTDIKSCEERPTPALLGRQAWAWGGTGVAVFLWALLLTLGPRWLTTNRQLLSNDRAVSFTVTVAAPRGDSELLSGILNTKVFHRMLICLCLFLY